MAPKSAAQLRWKMLAAVISGKAQQVEGAGLVSVRRVASLQLLEATPVADEIGEKALGYERMRFALPGGHEAVVRQRIPGTVTLEDLLGDDGVDNTGNVCMWPSEEVLAHYVLANPDLFRGRAVCELGAGMTGLAGLALGIAAAPSRVLITDGNRRAVDTLRKNIDINKPRFVAGCEMAADVLRWDRNASLAHLGKFDIVMVADCLFFETFHIDLIHTLKELLTSDGTIIILGPRRGKSMGNFLDKVAADAGLVFDESDSYDDRVRHEHERLLGTEEYAPDLHYPILLKGRLV